MQGELAMLRAEVRILADQLKDAENRSSAPVWVLPHDSFAFTTTAWCVALLLFRFTAVLLYCIKLAVHAIHKQS